jgi:hypothetical protein
VLRFRSIVTAISSVRKGGIKLVALGVVLLIIALAGRIAFTVPDYFDPGPVAREIAACKQAYPQIQLAT